MKRVFHNKLIRDKVVDKIKQNDEAFETRVISDEEEFKRELLKKIKEEGAEVSETSSKEEFLKELADLSIVIDSLKEAFKVSDQEWRSALEENKLRKGDFEKKLFLLWSEERGKEDQK